jgi:hypothetical protein
MELFLGSLTGTPNNKTTKMLLEAKNLDLVSKGIFIFS